MNTKIKILLMFIIAFITSGATWASEDKHSPEHNTHHESGHAGGISYDFFDITYLDVETEDEQGNGFLLRFTKNLGEKLYFVGEYGDSDLDHGDFTVFRAGLGLHTPFSDKVDGIAELTYESLEINEEHHHLDETGYGLAVGIRALFTEKLEGTARVRYVDLGHEDDTIFSVELLYLFTHSFGLVGAYEEGNEKIWTFGVRFQF